MSRTPSPPLKPSVLDRLLDDAPRNPQDVPQTASQLLTVIREAVRRDLENLLNSRCLPSSRDLEQLQDSLVNYGLPDFTSLGGPRDRLAFCEIIKSAIQRCEPRLRGIVVEPLTEADDAARPLTFRIAATLHVEPWSAPIVFDSYLDATNGSMDVKRGRL